MAPTVLQKIKMIQTRLRAEKIVLDSSLVGTTLQPFPFDITFRRTSNYAAAIGDSNPLYYETDPRKQMGVHPLFPVAVSWQIVEHLRELTDVPLPVTLLKQLVHQSEYLKIYRLLQPGEKIIVKGRFAGLLPHKIGVKLIVQLDYIDARNQIVVSEFTHAILVGAKCKGEGKVIDDLPQTIRVDENIKEWEEEIAVSRLTSYIYDGCSDIVSPIHTDRLFAQSIGLPDIILHGTATLAMSISRIIAREMDNDPRQISVIAAKFTDMVTTPNRLRVCMLKKEIDRFWFMVLNEQGSPVIRGGYVELKAKSDI